MAGSAVTATELKVASELLSAINIDESKDVLDADHSEDAERVVEYLSSWNLKHRTIIAARVSEARDAFSRLLKAQANKDVEGTLASVKEIASILEDLMEKATMSAASSNISNSTEKINRRRGRPKGSKQKKRKSGISRHGTGGQQKKGAFSSKAYKRTANTDIAPRGTGKRYKSSTGNSNSKGTDPLDGIVGARKARRMAIAFIYYREGCPEPKDWEGTDGLIAKVVSDLGMPKASSSKKCIRNVLLNVDAAKNNNEEYTGEMNAENMGCHAR